MFLQRLVRKQPFMNKTIFLVFIAMGILLYSCNSGHQQEKSKYPRWVGDSHYDPSLDDSTFQICYTENKVKQYFNFSEGFKYKGEKSALEQVIFGAYQPVDVQESGWVRIRFVVNCNGDAGRFRLLQSDSNYQETSFDERITSQLMKIVKSLDGWVIMPSGEPAEDYYLYLIFKIENGQIIEILP